MEGTNPTGVDHPNPSPSHRPLAAPAPSGLCDRLIRLTSDRARPRNATMVKQRLVFRPLHRRVESTPAADEDRIRDAIIDITNHLKPKTKESPLVPARQRCHPIPSPLVLPDNSIHSILVDLTNILESRSVDSPEAARIPLGNSHTSDDSAAEDSHRDTVLESTEGSLTIRFELAGWIFSQLHTYQREGLKWLWGQYCRRSGGILADDMGLGKTRQAAVFLAGLFHSGLIKRVLIVCQNIVLDHWTSELSAVCLNVNMRCYLSSNVKVRDSELQLVCKEGGVLLTTYDTVRLHYKVIRGDYYTDADDDEHRNFWDYIILDEGHLIKNLKTQRAKSLHAIPCVNRLILTGTPVQNNLNELWALFSFCCPEVLGDKKTFKTRYEIPITHGNNKNATYQEKQTSSAVAKELRDMIRPYFLRRMKDEVTFDAGPIEQTSLPQKNELIIWLKLTDFQRKLYEGFLKSGSVDSSKQGLTFSKINILKEICDHPGSLDISKVIAGMPKNQERQKFEKLYRELKDMNDSTSTLQIREFASCKLYFIMRLLENILEEKHHVLIFSQTLYMLNCVQEAMVSKGYKFARIDGNTEVTERHRIVEEFQGDCGAQILLISAKVGGLGVTLTKASRVIVINPSWNPSEENQCVDRAYRYGQTKDVIVYRLVTSGTIEEMIYKSQVFKGTLIRTATEEADQKHYFSREDHDELLSLPKQGFDISLAQKQLEEEHSDQLIDDSLKTHMKSLEQLGIAGVSYHSLLFKETPILPPMG